MTFMRERKTKNIETKSEKSYYVEKMIFKSPVWKSLIHSAHPVSWDHFLYMWHLAFFLCCYNISSLTPLFESLYMKLISSDYFLWQLFFLKIFADVCYSWPHNGWDHLHTTRDYLCCLAAGAGAGATRLKCDLENPFLLTVKWKYIDLLKSCFS